MIAYAHRIEPGRFFKDLWLMTKPTITLLVIVTTLPSVLLASSSLPTLKLLFIAIVGTALASGSAAVFNQLFEIDLDNRMERTRKRSLPSGRLPRSYAAIWGGLLGLLAAFILLQADSPVASIVALFGHLFYVFGYTLYLKPRTPQNIVIGGAAGAVGPLIGWAVVTGELAWPAWVLAAFVALWTPPHFWSLALHYKKDYAKVGIPMYPVVYGSHRTRKVIFLYTLTLIPTIFAIYIGNYGSLFYLLSSLTLTLKFVWDAGELYFTKNNQKSLPLFYYSCVYAFAIFGVLTVDRLWFFINSP